MLCQSANRLAWFVLTAVLAYPAAAAADEASPPPFTEGIHYTRVIPAGKVESKPGRLEVREFFWYGCPHCYEVEPYIEQWEMPGDVDFIRTPAMLGRAWQVHAHVYYALQALGRLDELHPVFFDALHAKRLRLQTPNQIAKFLAAHGVDKSDFQKALNSFVVETKIKRAATLSRDYEINSVPTFVVNGRYKLSPGTVGGYKQFTAALDYIVSLERKRLSRK